MNTPDNILELADSYIKIIFFGIVASMFYNMLAAILRGVGDSKTPLYFLILSSILNIGLDLFFIVVLKLNVAGAAYATVLAQGISVILCLIYMFRKFKILRAAKEDYYIDLATTVQMMKIGIPMALNYSIIAIGSMILQSAVNTFGSSVIAAFTAANKVEQISSQTLPAIGTAMSTYCGQNLGAGNYKRIFVGMRKAFFITVAAAGISALICIVFGKYLVALFLDNPSEEIFRYASMYLNTVSCFFVFLGFIFLYRTALQSLGSSTITVFSGIFEMICRIGIVWLLLEPFGYWAVRLASPVAWVGAGIPMMLAYFRWKRKTIQQKCHDR